MKCEQCGLQVFTNPGFTDKDYKLGTKTVHLQCQKLYIQSLEKQARNLRDSGLYTVTKR